MSLMEIKFPKLACEECGNYQSGSVLGLDGKWRELCQACADALGYYEAKIENDTHTEDAHDGHNRVMRMTSKKGN